MPDEHDYEEHTLLGELDQLQRERDEAIQQRDEARAKAAEINAERATAERIAAERSVLLTKVRAERDEAGAQRDALAGILWHLGEDILANITDPTQIEEFIADSRLEAIKAADDPFAAVEDS